MKRFLKSLTAVLCVAFISSTAFAGTDERGVFGGISAGVALPKTVDTAAGVTRSIRQEMDYSEIVFVTGKPLRFNGILTVTQSGSISETQNAGTYTVSYSVDPVNNDPADVLINRDMTFRVNYRKVQESGVDQVILDYTYTNWNEEIVAGGSEYTVVPRQSHFSRSIIKDITPGVSYYKGYSSIIAYYLKDDTDVVTVSQSGSVYGYDSPWSKTETERIDVSVDAGDWQLEAQVRPSVSVNKTIQYSPNEPSSISFDGNYYEVTKNQSALTYNIYQIPQQFERGTALSGAATIPVASTFEMLPAPDLAFLKGHYAESDIQKLFAMQILQGQTAQYQPAQAMTRAQFVTALVKAFKLPVESTPSTSGSRRNVTVLFSDVMSNRNDFPYLMSAYKNGLVLGKYSSATDTRFRPDDPVTMEEAVTMLMRGLGLENLGLANTTVTVFADDSKISNWAKREVAAAQIIGIIDMDAYGNLNPSKKLTKAESAAIINRTIDYMRSGLPVDYREHILNFAN